MTNKPITEEQIINDMLNKSIDINRVIEVINDPATCPVLRSGLIKKYKMNKFKMEQTFAIFGDPCTEYHETMEAAEQAGRELAESIADNMFGIVSGDYVVSRADEIASPETGLSNEVDFCKNLEWELVDGEDAESETAKYRILHSSLVEDIINDAIEVVEVDEDND